MASPREVVWGETLGEALDLLLEAEGSGPDPTEPPTPTPDARSPSADAGPTPTVQPGDAVAGRRPRPDRLRQPPLRARAGGAARRGLRPLRRGDRQGRGRAPAARGACTRSWASGRPRRRPAPRHDRGGDPGRLAPGHAGAAGDVAAGPRHVPASRRIPAGPRPDRRAAERGRASGTSSRRCSRRSCSAASRHRSRCHARRRSRRWCCCGCSAAGSSRRPRSRSWSGRSRRTRRRGRLGGRRASLVPVGACRRGGCSRSGSSPSCRSLLALSWGAIRIVAVAYRELTVPSDVAVALVAPRRAAAPRTRSWWSSSAGSSARRSARSRRAGSSCSAERVPTALGGRRRPARAPSAALRRPGPASRSCRSSSSSSVVGLAGSATWDALRAALSLGSDPLVGAASSLLALVALFAGGLLLIGVAVGLASGRSGP